MAILNQKKILNLIPKVSAPVTVHVSQGDVGTVIQFTLVKGDELFVDTGNLTASVHGVREDGANFGPYSCVLSGSTVSFPLHTEMTAVKGSALAEIVLVDSSSNKVGSSNFGIMVEEAVFPLGVTYDNDTSVYESILAYAQSIPAQVTVDYNTKINAETAARQAADSSLNEALASEITNRTNAVSGEASTRAAADTLLGARIDEIIAPSGEAPSAAEVTDARVGANGTTYSSLGNSIRGQISDVKSALSTTVNTTTISTENHNGYLGIDGEYAGTDTFHSISTEKIPCIKGQKFLYMGIGQTAAYSVLFYAGNTILSGAKYQSLNDYTEITIPNNADGVIFSSFALLADDVVFDVIPQTLGLDEITEWIDEQNKKMALEDIRVVDDEVKTTQNDFELCVNTLSNANPLYTNGFKADKDGILLGVVTNSEAAKIDVFIAKGDYSISGEWRNSALSVPVIRSAAHDSDPENYTAWVSSYNLEYKQGDEIYIRFYSGSFRYSNTIADVSYHVLANINASVTTANYIVSFNLLYSDLLNNIDYLARKLNLKICTIGDSLTQGVDAYVRTHAENYPYYLARKLGSSVTNCGRSGTSPRTWWDLWHDYYSFDNSIDIILIMFGTNGGLDTNTLATDVEPYDDWNDYANTSVGCYCKIIEWLMEETDNHAQIILITPPYSTYTSSQEATVINSNPVIKAIANRYQLPVIDVTNECGMGKFNGDVFRPIDGCHFNAKGYHRLGTFISSKVASMISKFNLTDVFNT